MELMGWFYKLYVRSQFWYLVYTVEVCVCMYARMHAKHKSYIQSTKSTCLLLKSKIYTSDWVVDFRDCTYNLHPTLFLMELTGWFYKLYVRSEFWYLVYTVEVCVCMYARMHAKHKSYIQSTKSTCLLLKSKIYTSDWVVDFRDCTYNLHPTLFLINCDKHSWNWWVDFTNCTYEVSFGIWFTPSKCVYVCMHVCTQNTNHTYNLQNLHAYYSKARYTHQIELSISEIALTICTQLYF